MSEKFLHNCRPPEDDLTPLSASHVKTALVFGCVYSTEAAQGWHLGSVVGVSQVSSRCPIL